MQLAFVQLFFELLIQCYQMRDRKMRKDGKIVSVPTHHSSCVPIFSPTKHIQRQSTLTHISKHCLALPLIVPLRYSNKSKRYPEMQIGTDITSPLTILNSKLQTRTIQDRTWLNQSISPNQTRRERMMIDRGESLKQLFTRSVLEGNGIGRITLQKKEKLKVFIDQGNNSRLISQLIRRRPNLKIVSSKKQANIVWTPFCDWQSVRQTSRFSTQQFKSESTIPQQQISSSIHFRKDLLKNKPSNKQNQICIEHLRIHNHLLNHHQITDKKSLMKNIRKYCKSNRIQENDVIPKTYHVEGGAEYVPLDVKQGVWIVKPGQDTNRGTGISVHDNRQQIVKAVEELYSKGKTALVQQYIDPLLYRGRKFDIRCYALITSFAGKLRAYWYRQGYLRTCCRQFSYDPSNFYGHLTNDAVQKKHKDYGKYEAYNKLSFSQLQTLLRSKEISYQGVMQRMKELAQLSIRSAQQTLCSERNIFGFEILGYDFLIDSKGKVWLIEVNTNPCLQFAGSLLSRVIWHMVENGFAIAIDPFLTSLPQSYIHQEQQGKICKDNKFINII